MSFDHTTQQTPQLNTIQPSTGRGWRFYAAFGCLSLVNLMCALAATSLAVTLPIIAENLHASGIEAFWAGTSFLLTSTVFQLTFTSLSNIFGRKPVLLLALTLFTIGAIIAAIPNNFTPMLIGRSIQGVGGGGISALTYVIITDMVRLKERGKWLGLITMMRAFGNVIGPVLGGSLAEEVSWRWIFWLNVPFCLLSFSTIPFFLKFKPKDGKISDKIRRTDWVGSFIFITSITALLIPITWGGVMYPWYHWKTVVPLVLSVFGFLSFTLWSKYVSREPILRGSMFRDSTSLITYFTTIIHGMFLLSVLYYMPLYFEAAKGFSPISAGVAMFPWTFTTGPAAAIVGLFITRSGRYRWAIWVGWLLTAVGSGLLALLKADTITVIWVSIFLVSGLGLGILYPAMSFTIQATASSRDLPFVAALYSFFRSFGQMLGVGVAGVIFQNEVKKHLLTYPDFAQKAAELSKDVSALVEVIRRMSIEEDGMKRELVMVYVDSLRVLWVIMCALSGIAFVAGLFTKERSLERGVDTDQEFMFDVRPGSTAGVEVT